MPQNLQYLKYNVIWTQITNLPISLKELEIGMCDEKLIKESKIPYGCKVIYGTNTN